MTFKYDEILEHKREQDIKNSLLPTVQLKLKNRNILYVRDAVFINDLIKDFYEKPELFNNPEFKAQKSIIEMMDLYKDEDYYLSEKHSMEIRLRRFNHYYESFKKKKYIKILTKEGKIARKANLHEAYIVLTDLGVKEFLNLEKLDLKSQINPFMEEYKNEFSFVSEENKKYIYNDYIKIKIEISKIFDKIEPLLRDFYSKYYLNIKNQILSFIDLSSEEQEEFRKTKLTENEFDYLLRKVSSFNYSYRKYILDLEDNKFDKLLEMIINMRLEVDREEFVNKQSAKMGSIIKGRKYNLDIKSYSINNSINNLETTLDMKFEDNAKFIAKTQIVGVTNDNGNFFFRKPTTFHNVYYSNGEKMSNVSYEKLVKEL